jgi:hypothetical protein
VLERGFKMLAKTKPADLAVNFGKLAVIINQEFKKIRSEIRENSPSALLNY